MTFKIVVIFLVLLITSSCIISPENKRVEVEGSRLKVDLQELLFSDSIAIKKVMLELKSNYNFEVDTSEISVLLVKNERDSVFFDFIVFDKMYLKLLFDITKTVKERGVFFYNGSRILVFDEIGLFKSKSISQNVDFGIQNTGDLLFYEPLKYRYYLNERMELKFIDEFWF